MITRKKSDAPKKSSKTKSKDDDIKTLKMNDGTVQGEYSTSVYNNGELISFDIDWDKLRDHMKKVG